MDTHKKAILASSLIKNVISKKMQFEQERKMERGEISEVHPVPPSCLARRESDAEVKGGWGQLRHASEFHSSSQYTEMCVEEPDGSDGSPDPSAGSRERAPAKDSEPTGEAGIVTKIGTSEGFSSAPLHGQNNAFRCWRDGEVEFQKEHKNHQSVGERSAGDVTGRRCSENGGKTTKMSHLFVQSIQLQSNNENVQKQRQRTSLSPHGGGGDVKLRSDSTLYIADSRNVTASKPPEIKINLRSTRGNRNDPSGDSKLLSPGAGCTAARFVKADNSKYQLASKGEASDRVPHFVVRDVRDGKGKLQTPIYQVRDVRKLVKSSYHCVPSDNTDNKCPPFCTDSQQEQKTRNLYGNVHSVSPIVIKYQSVNTTCYEKPSDDIESAKLQTCDVEQGTNEATSDSMQREPLILMSNSEESNGLRPENTPKKQEKSCDTVEKKSELKIPNHVALEKLQAAVKTMEQLYVFEKNEWKRKNDPQPLTDSQVLSLIASEDVNRGPDGGGARGHSVDKTCSSTEKSSPTKMSTPIRESLMKQDDQKRKAPQSVQAWSTSGGKAVLNLSSSIKSTTPETPKQLNANRQNLVDTRNPALDFPKLPVALRHNQAGQRGNEADESKAADRFSSASTDNDNYLTIPVNVRPPKIKQSFSEDKLPFCPSPGPTGTGIRSQINPKPSSIVMETHLPERASASIYHSLPQGLPPTQPQFFCFSPAVNPSLNMEAFQTIERKMLLDPSSGNYYLVDTPVQVTTKRLFDPELGQYVEVPMTQPPMAPMPFPIQHLALSPGPAYMLYPSFMPTPSLMATQPLMKPSVGGEEPLSVHQTEGVFTETPVYMTTGTFPQTPSGAQPPAPTTIRPPHGISSIKRPVISFSPQQGTRIVAPPSFDGTTMSFVVEHR